MSDGPPALPIRLSLGNRVMVLHGPLGVASGTANGWLTKAGVTDTEYPKLGGQAIQIQADAVEVGIGGAASQRGGDRVLRGRICDLKHNLAGFKP